MEKQTQIQLLNRTKDFIRICLIGDGCDPSIAYELQEDIQRFLALEFLELVHLANAVFVSHTEQKQLDTFLSENMKIKAIKALRTSNRLSLKEAKDCIDEYALNRNRLFTSS